MDTLLILTSPNGLLWTCQRHQIQILFKGHKLYVPTYFFIGILLIFVLVVYPVGWSTNRIQRLCRPNNTYEIPKAYSIGDCSLGSAYYCAIAAALTAFICSLLSFPADKAVFADKVQDEILEGKQMICTL